MTSPDELTQRLIDAIRHRAQQVLDDDPLAFDPATDHTQVRWLPGDWIEVRIGDCPLGEISVASLAGTPAN